MVVRMARVSKAVRALNAVKVDIQEGQSGNW